MYHVSLPYKTEFGKILKEGVASLLNSGVNVIRETISVTKIFVYFLDK